MHIQDHASTTKAQGPDTMEWSKEGFRGQTTSLAEGSSSPRGGKRSDESEWPGFQVSIPGLTQFQKDQTKEWSGFPK